jgi:hypothetical protein
MENDIDLIQKIMPQNTISSREQAFALTILTYYFFTSGKLNENVSPLQSELFSAHILPP